MFDSPAEQKKITTSVFGTSAQVQTRCGLGMTGLQSLNTGGAPYINIII